MPKEVSAITYSLIHPFAARDDCPYSTLQRDEYLYHSGIDNHPSRLSSIDIHPSGELSIAIYLHRALEWLI